MNAEPLTPAVFHILLALAGKPKHGYAVMREVEQQSGGSVRMGPGTLYGSMDRLRETKWIEECAAPAGEVNADERRRYYRLTPTGRVALAREAERLEKAVAALRQYGVLVGAKAVQG